MTFPALQYFSTLSHKVTIFEKKKSLLNIKRVPVPHTRVPVPHTRVPVPLHLVSDLLFILRRTEGNMIKKMCISLHVKYSLLLSDFNET